MIRSKVLREAVSYWKEHFKGVGALELADSLGLSHGRVLSILRNLETRGLGSCRPIGPGQRILVEMAADGGARLRGQPSPASVIFFPDQKVLQEEFSRAGVDHGPYSNLLHLGESQLALRYFKHEVLATYSEQQDKYYFEDSATGGWIGTRDQYYFSLEGEGKRSEAVGQVRYGKRCLRDGRIAVAAIVNDLASLPSSEQRFWESREIRDPTFADEDPDFDAFVRQVYGGEWLDEEDPIDAVYGAVRLVNEAAVPHTVFRQEKPNPYLRYPVFNNRRAYSAAHKELQKVAGTDNLDVKGLRSLLRALIPEVEVSPSDGGWALFKRGVRVLFPEDPKAVLAPLENVFAERSLDTHEIDPLSLESQDFHDRFKRDCQDVAAALVRIAERVAATLRPANAGGRDRWQK